MDIKLASVRELLEEILSRGEAEIIEPFPHNEHSNEDSFITVALNDTIGMEFYYPVRVIVVYPQLDQLLNNS